MAARGAKAKKAEACADRPPSLSSPSPAPSYHSLVDEANESLQQQVPTSSGSVEYGLYYTKSHTHMIVCSAQTEQKTPLYFVEVSEFTYKKTDVQMHRINADVAEATPCGRDLATKVGVTGPVIAVARFPTLSRDFNIGFGDFVGTESFILWEQVKNAQRVGHGQYDFFYTDPHEGPSAQPVKYSWCRTHAEEDGVEGSKWKRVLNRNCWKLVDHRSSRTIALVTANFVRKWKKAGQMLILGGKERSLEVMILLTFSAIAEKARRREWKRRTAGAGGGGGGG